ncbi:MAG: hypothetical protein WA869_30255, partial [Alloacidobacterium sp.]
AMPLGVRLKYLAPQVVFVGSRHPRLRRRVSPLLHYTIIGIALVRWNPDSLYLRCRYYRRAKVCHPRGQRVELQHSS